MIIKGSLDLPRVQAVLFDVDGTLSDTDDRMVARLCHSLRSVSWLFKNHDPTRFARWLITAVETPGNFLYSLADRLGVDDSLLKLITPFTQKRREVNPDHAQFWLIPGIEEMLATLSKIYPLAVVSARDQFSTEFFLDAFYLRHYFSVIVTSQTCEHTKPFPDPILYTAEALGVEPGECVMVGDTTVDIQSAKSAGAQTVGVLCGFGSLRELERAEADLIVSSTADITEIINL